MNQPHPPNHSLAAKITRTASKQTYYTILLFVDRKLVGHAYRAYGYFRWVDDRLDAETGLPGEKAAFVNRQRELLEAVYQGNIPPDLCPEENMLVELARSDAGTNPGLRSYLRNMMAVMEFDLERHGRVISQAELAEYSRLLATAVTDAMHYFIGHADPLPSCHEARYLAVTAAHITHMLRDAHEDAAVGYFNIPGEYLQANKIAPQDLENRAYRQWVCGRVQLARKYFSAGRQWLAQVKSWRCRLAAYAYMARFEWLLQAVERDRYCLRCEYPARKSLRAALWMGWSALTALFASAWIKAAPRDLAAQPVWIEKR